MRLLCLLPLVVALDMHLGGIFDFITGAGKGKNEPSGEELYTEKQDDKTFSMSEAHAHGSNSSGVREELHNNFDMAEGEIDWRSLAQTGGPVITMQAETKYCGGLNNLNQVTGGCNWCGGNVKMSPPVNLHVNLHECKMACYNNPECNAFNAKLPDPNDWKFGRTDRAPGDCELLKQCTSIVNPGNQQDHVVYHKVSIQHCELSAWNYGACSKTCGGGTQTLTRTIVTPPGPGGVACDQMGPLTQDNYACNTHGCPVNCQVSGWSGWGTCSKTCGGGVQKRTRSLTRAASGGGTCSVNTFEESRSCNTEVCSVDCAGSWGSCSTSCNRVWTETTAQAGAGSACPAQPGCSPGDGDCPRDCAGSWGSCTTSCNRIWTETAAQHGIGAACPAEPSCAPGSDHCPSCTSLPGVHLANPGDLVCTPCAAGFFSAAGQDGCSPCAAGTFSIGPAPAAAVSGGAAAATICRDGTARACSGEACTAAGFTATATACLIASVVVASETACSDCGTGDYAAGNGPGACIASGGTVATKAQLTAWLDANHADLSPTKCAKDGTDLIVSTGNVGQPNCPSYGNANGPLLVFKMPEGESSTSTTNPDYGAGQIRGPITNTWSSMTINDAWASGCCHNNREHLCIYDGGTTTTTTTTASSSSTVVGRYVRIENHDASQPMNPAEIRVYGPSGELTPLSAELSSTLSSTYPASNCIDGDTGTICHSREPATDESWLVIDMGQAVEITSIEYINDGRGAAAGYERAVGDTVSVTEDHDGATVLWTSDPIASATNGETFTFDPSAGAGSSSSGTASLYVYGKSCHSGSGQNLAHIWKSGPADCEAACMATDKCYAWNHLPSHCRLYGVEGMIGEDVTYGGYDWEGPAGEEQDKFQLPNPMPTRPSTLPTEYCEILCGRPLGADGEVYPCSGASSLLGVAAVAQEDTAGKTKAVGDAGASSCTACPVGTFSNAEAPGEGECTPCPDGYYTDAEGTEHCLARTCATDYDAAAALGPAGLARTAGVTLPALFTCPPNELFTTSNRDTQILGEDHATCCDASCHSHYDGGAAGNSVYMCPGERSFTATPHSAALRLSRPRVAETDDNLCCDRTCSSEYSDSALLATTSYRYSATFQCPAPMLFNPDAGMNVIAAQSSTPQQDIASCCSRTCASEYRDGDHGPAQGGGTGGEPCRTPSGAPCNNFDGWDTQQGCEAEPGCTWFGAAQAPWRLGTCEAGQSADECPRVDAFDCPAGTVFNGGTTRVDGVSGGASGLAKACCGAAMRNGVEARVHEDVHALAGSPCRTQDGAPCNWDTQESCEFEGCTWFGAAGLQEINHLSISPVARRDCVEQKTMDQARAHALQNGQGCFQAVEAAKTVHTDGSTDGESLCNQMYEIKFRGDHRHGHNELGRYNFVYDLIGEVHFCSWMPNMGAIIERGRYQGQCDTGGRLVLCPEEGHVVEVAPANVAEGATESDRTGPKLPENTLEAMDAAVDDAR